MLDAKILLQESNRKKSCKSVQELQDEITAIARESNLPKEDLKRLFIRLSRDVVDLFGEQESSTSAASN